MRLITGGFDSSSLLPALRCLDLLLGQAIATLHAHSETLQEHPFRGLYVSKSEVDDLLEREPGVSPWHMQPDTTPEVLAHQLIEIQTFARLVKTYALSPFDLCILMIAIAPELDLRYEGIFAYLHNNVTRRRPSVDVVLNLLCRSAAERVACRVNFAAEAPLFAYGLVHLIEDPTYPNPTLLARFLRVDDQVVNFLLGQHLLDRRLMPFCERIEPLASPSNITLSPNTLEALHTVALDMRNAQKSLAVYFCGPPDIEKQTVAQSIAAHLDLPLLAVDLTEAAHGDSIEQIIGVLAREAALWDTVLYIEGADVIPRQTHSTFLRMLLRMLAQRSGLVILTGMEPWTTRPEDLKFFPIELVDVAFPMPTYVQRRSLWELSLAEAGITLDDEELDALDGRFSLSSGGIRHAIAGAGTAATWQNAHRSSTPRPVIPPLAKLFSAARTQSTSQLGSLAHKLEPFYRWNDIVLPDETMALLSELCQRVIFQHRVFEQWGFNNKLSAGRGVTAMFSGSSGTGKTMAAEVIAAELSLDLYRIDLAGVVSKYIGETEKNLDRIFAAAENSNSILFFDEADALFGKRSEVHDSHDRYANIEISYLLQKMEQYQGIAVLATNLGQNLDDAFVRRLTFTIHFPFPDEAARLRIWAGMLPDEMPVDPAVDADLEYLARQFNLSGGSIKNIVLAAAFIAVQQERPLSTAHLLHATQREYQKLGKTLSAHELYGERQNGFWDH